MANPAVNDPRDSAKAERGIASLSLNGNGPEAGKSGDETAISPAEKEKVELTPQIKQVIKSTVPLLKRKASDIALRFYHLMFERHPELKKQFNMDRQMKGTTKTEGLPSQVSALSKAIISYAANIDRLEVLLPTITGIAHKHVSRGVVPFQYDYIGESLISAFKDTLGSAATEEIISAWTVAYAFLAKVFIDIEKSIKEAAEKQAGYSGLKKMTVKHIDDGKDGARTLWVLPEDGVVPRHFAGQFLVISLADVEGVGPAMLTVFIDEVSASELRLRVPKNEERATKHVFENVQTGTVLDVGVACGVAKSDE